MKTHYPLKLCIYAATLFMALVTKSQDLDPTFGTDGRILVTTVTGDRRNTFGNGLIAKADNSVLIQYYGPASSDFPNTHQAYVRRMNSNGTIFSGYTTNVDDWGTWGLSAVFFGELSTNEVISVTERSYFNSSYPHPTLKTTYLRKIASNGTTVATGFEELMNKYYTYEAFGGWVNGSSNNTYVCGRLKPFVAAWRYTPSTYQSAPYIAFISSYSSSLSLNSGFGINGVLTLAGVNNIIEVKPSGSNLFALAATSVTGSFRIIKLAQTNGALQAGFGSSGFLTITATGTPKLATDGLGDVYFNFHNRITKINGNTGAVVTGWGNSGTVVATTSGYSSLSSRVLTVDNNNRVVFAYVSGANIVVLRYLSADGSLDMNFSGDGRGVGLATSATIRAVVTDANHDVYVAGEFFPSGHEAFRATIWKFRSNIPVATTNTSVVSLSGFSATYGTNSSTQTYQVSGSNLSGNLNITAPAFAEISLNGMTYSNSLSISPVSGSIASTTIFVRLNNTANSGTLTGVLNHSAFGAPQRNVSMQAVVSRAVLTVTALNNSRPYNTPNPSFSHSISGFRNGDNIGVISGSFSYATTASQSSNVGTYPIHVNVSALSATNYTFTTVAGILTINKIDPTLAITSPNSGTVTGTVTLTAASNSGGTVTWSIVSGTAASISGSNVLQLLSLGNVTLRATVASTTNYHARSVDQQFSVVGNTTPILVADDYVFVFTGTGSFVYPVSSNSPGGITFDVLAWGSEGLQITATSGFLNPFNVFGAGYSVVRVNQAASAPFTSTSKIVTITGLRGQSVTSITGLSPAHANPVAGTTYSILTSFLYAAGAATYTVFNSNNEVISSSTSPTILVTVPGVYKIRCERPGNTNFLGSFDEKFFNFSPASFTPFFTDPSTILTTYGNPSFTIAGFVNPVANARSTVVWSIDPISLNPNAGSMSPDGVFTPLRAGNLVIRATVPPFDQYGENFAVRAVSISRRNITLSGVNASRDYGDQNPAFEYTIEGMLNNDAVADHFTGAPLFNTAANFDVNVGDYPVNLVHSGYLFSDTYQVGVVRNATISVLKAPLKVIPNNLFITYGDPIPAFTYSVSGFKLNQNASVITGTPVMGVASATGVGVYSINVTTSGMNAANYRFESEQGFLTISRKILTVAAVNLSRNYGQSNPTLTYSILGFVAGDNASVITGVPTLQTVATASSNAGTYVISITGDLSAANYDFVFANGTLTVNKATLTVSGGNYARTYGQSNPTFAATFSGFVNGDTQSGAVSGSPVLSTVATSTSDAGTYTVTVTSGSLASTNYNFLFVNGQLVINKAPLQVGVAPVSRLYGESNPSFTATYAGFVLGQNASVLSGAPSFSTAANATSSVGNYTIHVGAGTLAATNYSFQTVSGMLTVNKATLTVTSINASRLYGEPNPTFNHTITGFKNGDNSSVISGTPTLNTLANSSSNVGTYAISVNVSGMSATNYDFVGVSGTLTINKANRSISITSPNTGRIGTTVTLSGIATPSATISWAVQNGTGSASVLGNELTLSTIGVVTVTATTASDANYNASTAIQIYTITNLTVPTINFANISKTFTDAPFQLVATSNSPAAKVYSVLSSSPVGIVQVSPTGMVTILGAGTATVQVSQAEQDGFAAISQSAQLTVAKKMAGIVINVSSESGVVGNAITFSGNATTGNPTLIWDVVNETGSASISGNNLQLLSEGTVRLRATINEDANYLENQAWKMITIVGITPTSLTIIAPSVDTLNKTITLEANTTPLNLPVQWSVANGTGSAEFVSSNVLSLTGVGVVTVTGSIVSTSTYLASSATHVITIVSKSNNNNPDDNTSLTGINTQDEYGYIYPNPSQGWLYLNSNVNGSSILNIYSVQGLLLYSKQWIITTAVTPINLSELATGAYIVEWRTYKGVKSLKWIKN